MRKRARSHVAVVDEGIPAPSQHWWDVAGNERAVFPVVGDRDLSHEMKNASKVSSESGVGKTLFCS
jgi:hypothetical protein